MTPRELPATRTPVSTLDMYSALGEALSARLPAGTMRRESVLCLVAHWQTETGGRSCYCFNITNVRHTLGDGRNWCILPSCSEVDSRGVEHHYSAAEQPDRCMFRAFESLDAGVTDYLATLARDFPKSLAAAIEGDPADFAQALHDEHFYTASVAGYTRLLLSLYHALDLNLPTL